MKMLTRADKNIWQQILEGLDEQEEEIYYIPFILKSDEKFQISLLTYNHVFDS